MRPRTKRLDVAFILKTAGRTGLRLPLLRVAPVVEIHADPARGDHLAAGLIVSVERDLRDRREPDAVVDDPRQRRFPFRLYPDQRERGFSPIEHGQRERAVEWIRHI